MREFKRKNKNRYSYVTGLFTVTWVDRVGESMYDQVLKRHNGYRQ